MRYKEIDGIRYYGGVTPAARYSIAWGWAVFGLGVFVGTVAVCWYLNIPIQ